MLIRVGAVGIQLLQKLNFYVTVVCKLYSVSIVSHMSECIVPL